jgi:hypothetical protein
MCFLKLKSKQRANGAAAIKIRVITHFRGNESNIAWRSPAALAANYLCRAKQVSSFF